MVAILRGFLFRLLRFHQRNYAHTIAVHLPRGACKSRQIREIYYNYSVTSSATSLTAITVTLFR